MSNYIYTNDGLVNADYLAHYGVPGMKWGRRKVQRLQGKIDRINRQEDRYRNKILGKREKNYTRLMERYDRKIEKAQKKGDESLVNVRKQNKKEVSNDFKKGNKIVTKALDIRRENRTKYLELSKKSVNDPSIKETKGYKTAKRWYKTQRLSDNFYGRDVTTLQESVYVAQGQYWTRAMTDK